MNEHPIIFNSEMVRAILDGRKIQTRRVIGLDMNTLPNSEGRLSNKGVLQFRCPPENIVWRDIFWGNASGSKSRHCKLITCPYGKVGDLLWVRENWCTGIEWDDVKPSEVDPLCGGNDLWYLAGNNEVENPNKLEKPEGYGKTRPSIFLPRWACRIFLEITAIRVERVQEIGFEDCRAEGIHKWRSDDCLNRFHYLWDSINAKRAPWEDNPWVWVIEFKSKVY